MFIFVVWRVKIIVMVVFFIGIVFRDSRVFFVYIRDCDSYIIILYVIFFYRISNKNCVNKIKRNILNVRIELK